ncbi:MAG: YceI family protein [Deltaproteobacteria bacterium]|nr:YceI family protein [Deltaproteobacteria bacterium]
MKKQNVFLVALAALCASAANAASLDVSLPKGSAELSFDAVGKPSALRIRGTTSAVEGGLTGASGKLTGKFSADLATLDTGLRMRNEHMTKKYLETERFPRSELVILGIKKLPAGPIAAGDYDFEGELSLHGVKKPVRGLVHVTRATASEALFEASFEVSLVDYGIATPSFAGITVANQVTINVKGKTALKTL